MTTYYVDSSSSAARNDNAGISQAAPLADLAGVQALALKPGDTVALKAGTTYTGSVDVGGLLNLSASGTAAAPITLTAYGTGPAPVIDNRSTATTADGIDLNGSYQVVSGLAFTGAGNAAVLTGADSRHDTVTGNSMTGTGFGVYAYGMNHTITSNTISDLHMVNNTPTSVNDDDDYGAVGVVVNGNGDEVAFNRITGAKASSYDYGVDGGAVETWGDVDGLSVHDNYAQGDAGFFESGGGNVSNVSFTNNVSVDDGGFFVLHNGGGAFGGAYANLSATHNTIVESGSAPHQNATIVADAALQGALTFDDNVVSSADGLPVFDAAGVAHGGNVADLSGGGSFGTALGSGDALVRLDFKDPAAGDYTTSSTAAGATLTEDETGATGAPTTSAALVDPAAGTSAALAAHLVAGSAAGASSSGDSPVSASAAADAAQLLTGGEASPSTTASLDPIPPDAGLADATLTSPGSAHHDLHPSRPHRGLHGF